MLIPALSERLDGKIRFVAHAPRALPLIRIKSLLFSQLMGKVAGVSLTDEVWARLNYLFTGVIAVLILKARPLGELRREAVRGLKCVSKALSRSERL